MEAELVLKNSNMLRHLGNVQIDKNLRNGHIADAISSFTIANNNFDTFRNYIPLSQMHLSVDEIITSLQKGYETNILSDLKCYKGYQMEADMKRRIKSIFGERVDFDFEISAHNGLVKGHPDFNFDRYPADCKSVLMDDWLPKDNKLPRKVYWQMQGYMLYMNKDKSLVVYESRESGLISDFWIRANANIQKEIKDKVQTLVDTVNYNKQDFPLLFPNND
jgi:hypothetical protein